MTIKEMYEQRATIGKRIKELAERANEKDRQWTAEDETNWTAANADYDKVSKDIERAERAEKVAAEQVAHETPPPAATRDGGTVRAEDRDALALQGWMRAQTGLDIEDRHVEAMRMIGITPSQRHFDITLPDTREWIARRREMRTDTYNSTAAGYGGQVIPAGFVPNFENALLSFGGILQVADVLRTDSGNALTWPTANDTGNTGELIGEVQDSTDSAVSASNLTTSSLTLNAYNYSSKLVRVSTSLLEDSAFDLASWIGGALGERIGRKLNTDFTTANGSDKPNGIVTAATAGATSSAAAAIDEDDILGLVHSVDPAYRLGAGWLFHDNVLLAIRKIKDTNGQFLWQPGLATGAPSVLAGYPYTINQDMSSTITGGDVTALFGALNKYKVRMVRQIRLRRLVERYAEYDQDGFVAFMRADADLLDAGTHPVKKLTQTGGGS
jgi:HK97 family phage major capsid protein